MKFKNIGVFADIPANTHLLHQLNVNCPDIECDDTTSFFRTSFNRKQLWELCSSFWNIEVIRMSMSIAFKQVSVAMYSRILIIHHASDQFLVLRSTWESTEERFQGVSMKHRKAGIGHPKTAQSSFFWINYKDMIENGKQWLLTTRTTLTGRYKIIECCGPRWVMNVSTWSFWWGFPFRYDDWFPNFVSLLQTT